MHLGKLHLLLGWGSWHDDVDEVFFCIIKQFLASFTLFSKTFDRFPSGNLFWHLPVLPTSLRNHCVNLLLLILPSTIVLHKLFVADSVHVGYRFPNKINTSSASSLRPTLLFRTLYLSAARFLQEILEAGKLVGKNTMLTLDRYMGFFINFYIGMPWTKNFHSFQGLQICLIEACKRRLSFFFGEAWYRHFYMSQFTFFFQSSISLS